MFHAILVDDEPPALSILKRQLEKTGQIHVVGSFSSAAETLAEIESLRPDVAFLDIEMPDMSGLELAGKILDLDIAVEIVFVTAYDRYALEAFRANAIDYILKPFSQDDLAQAIQKLQKVKPLPAGTQLPGGKGRICCFGRLTVYGAGSREPVKWRTAKTEELFAFMLKNLNTRVTKWKITQVLWPECEAENQLQTNLYTTVYKVKKTLLAANISFSFTCKNGSYKLALPDAAIDAAVFEAFANSAPPPSETTVERYQKTLALYKGNYLEDNDYSWAQDKAEEYLRRYRGLVAALANYYTIRTDYANAEKVLREALGKAPLDDELNEMLLRLYFTKKDKASLITHYNKIKGLYHAELGITPNAALRELFERAAKL